ncbi:RNA polymerase sigma-70 factor [Parabacteroides distasonis]|nr:RNA polymerase sigma-70 factor [Parabacteroides distasonis]
MEERQIIKSLKEGDREAFSMLYKQYWEKVYHFCGLYLNNRDVAEDVVQEVFIKVWESREFIREDDNFKGLLFVITRNLIFNQHRKNVNEDFYKMTVLSAMETSYDLEEEITAYNLGEYIDHLIEELPERRRVIFNLSRKEHKSYKEIAFQLNISEKTVENQISEALKFLKKISCYLSGLSSAFLGHVFVESGSATAS